MTKASDNLLFELEPDYSERTIKPFWSNLLWELDAEAHTPCEEIFKQAGQNLRDALTDIEFAIKDHDLQKALQLIEDLRQYV